MSKHADVRTNWHLAQAIADKFMGVEDANHMKLAMMSIMNNNDPNTEVDYNSTKHDRDMQAWDICNNKYVYQDQRRKLLMECGWNPDFGYPDHYTDLIDQYRESLGSWGTCVYMDKDGLVTKDSLNESIRDNEKYLDFSLRRDMRELIKRHQQQKEQSFISEY